MAGAHAVDLSVLIQTQSRLDDHSPAPPASTLPLPLRRPPPARGREPCPAAAARRVQKNDGPTQAAHDGSPLLDLAGRSLGRVEGAPRDRDPRHRPAVAAAPRSEEHTSELQSHSDLVCRLLLEKKKPEICLLDNSLPD